ncbi:RHS repeat-associated core domain-containing protein [Micromonospora sp. NPDC049559]|uniref:RHS repeat-associated core domain-containing protein n=1 Tax=Micromonospora sp. NPDC049559 TaxID=3155923 RepID=UPI003443A4B1
MGVTRRRIAAVMAAVLAASMAAVLVRPEVAVAAGGPSVPLPETGSTAVEPETVSARSADQATDSALHGDQPPHETPADGGGTAKATPLSPSATWEVSGQTGDFSWSYPLRVPPSPGGLDPELSLSYSSSLVDGRTSATNNQASWVGDGWDLSPGFIERTYLPCAEDTTGGTTPPTGVGDLCWRSDNAIGTYNGGGGMLICCDGDGRWRSKIDDGSRIERLTGAGNGDNDGEYWKVTRVDGTQYFFGSRPEAKSTWTVPVFGDDTGEPCHGATFDASHCVQAWRWNLDRVVDRNGNTMIYTYDAETNSYGLNLKDTAVSYTRGGTLSGIEYGLRDGQPATGRVVFAVADRCVPGSTCTPDRKDNWPDVPWDDRCDTATCKDRYSPTFWSTKRLTKITTQVRRGAGFTDVDAWTLDQQFPDPGDAEKATLWLHGITHTGLVGGSVALPAVTFEGTKMPNRVYEIDGVAPLNRYRITGVISESGGLLSVRYADPDCVADVSMPANPETNTKRCFPVRWNKRDYAERTDYFHKYVVAEVTQSDRSGVNTEQVTDYEYLDGAAWHYDTSEFTKDDKRTWDEFRGFARVVIRSGKRDDPSGPTGKIEQRFYRGMNGDRLPTGTRSVSVSATEGAPRPDEDWLQGRELETITYDGDTDRVVSKAITDPTWQGPTATRGAFKAYLVRTGAEQTYTALAGGGWRTTRTESTYDDRGLLTRTNDLGDTATGADDRCTRVWFARNTDRWLLDFPYRQETVGVACGATASYPRDAISDVRTGYDGNAPGQVPSAGNPTVTEQLKDHPAGADPSYVRREATEYDAYGRVTAVTDARGKVTRTAYTPAAGGPATQTVVTNPLGHTVTTTLEPAWAKETVVVDENKRRTETGYDPLGRTAAVWLANRLRSDYPDGPSSKFAYLIRNDAPNVVTTTSVGPNGNYTTSKEIYDGLQRLRQKQEPAVGGGRLLTDTRYDSQGRVYKATQPYFNDAPVDDNLWVASDTAVPGLTLTRYDGAGRKTAEIFQAGGQEKWRTTTGYGGDRVHVTPPQGGIATTTITDARGQTVELREYHGGQPSGAYDATTYTYTRAGQPASITDPAGNTWRFEYDLRGNQTRVEDVDKGVATMTYDDAGQLVSETDARDTTLTYGYDDLGRKTSLRSGNTVLASWSYDTALKGKGRLASATRYVGTSAYTRTIASYTALYDVGESAVTIPESEQTLAGTYTTYESFNPDGTAYGTAYPRIGDLPEETVSREYDDVAGPSRLSGGPAGGPTVNYVTDTAFTRYGEVARVQLGDAGRRVWQSYYYDDSTRRLDRTVVDAELPRPMQADLHYAYDPSGNVTSVANTPLEQPADVQCFRYDHLQRLTEAWTPAGGCATAPDAAALAGPAPYWQSFTYDLVGNRLTETRHALSGDTVRRYGYPAAGAHRLASVTTTEPGGATRTDEYGYDAAGNTTRRDLSSGDAVLTWDETGKLTRLTEGDDKTTEYVYDADGNRLIRRDPTGSTLYLDGQELRLDKVAGRLTGTRYYQHGDNTVAMRTAAGVTWLASDHQGTAQLSVDSATQRVVQRRQAPFGAPRGAAVTFPGERGFVGGTIDSSTGLTNLGARQYDPLLGRFISVDPVMDLSDAQQMHGYTYANNSPIAKADPTGLFWGELWNGVKNAVGTAARAVGNAAKTVGNAVATAAKYAAPVIGTAALVASMFTPVGAIATGIVVGLNVLSFGVGAINAIHNCTGGGSGVDCAMDIFGAVPGVGKIGLGMVRTAQLAGKLASREVASTARLWNAVEANGTNAVQWLEKPLLGKTGEVWDTMGGVTGTIHGVMCDYVGLDTCNYQSDAAPVIQPNQPYAQGVKPKPLTVWGNYPHGKKTYCPCKASFFDLYGGGIYGAGGSGKNSGGTWPAPPKPKKPTGVPDSRGNYYTPDGKFCNQHGRTCAV